MAEHPDIVEREIADSTDDQPASRRRVTDAIRNSLDSIEPVQILRCAYPPYPPGSRFLSPPMGARDPSDLDSNPPCPIRDRGRNRPFWAFSGGSQGDRTLRLDDVRMPRHAAKVGLLLITQANFLITMREFLVSSATLFHRQQLTDADLRWPSPTREPATSPFGKPAEFRRVCRSARCYPRGSRVVFPGKQGSATRETAPPLSEERGAASEVR